MKIPVFGVLNKESDAHELVQLAKCGSTTLAGSTSTEIGQAFLDLVSKFDSFDHYGVSGYAYAQQHFEITVVINQLLEEINARKT